MLVLYRSVINLKFLNMKQTVYILAGVILFLLGIVVYEMMNGPKPVSTDYNAYKFPCLIYSVDSVRSWDKDTSRHYDDFFFTPFAFSNQSPWQVVCYGQQKTSTGHFYYHPLDSNPFPIYPDSSGLVEDGYNLVFSAMVVKADSLRKMTNDNDSLHTRKLLLVPYLGPRSTVQDNFKHLHYRVYLIEQDPITKKIARFVKLRGNIFDSSSTFVKGGERTPNINEYIELNPCPPHTWD